MKVSELITRLQSCDPNDLVVLSSDEEGNSFSHLGGMSFDMSFAEGEVYLRELTPRHREQGYTEEDVLADGERAVVLWP